MKIILEQKMLKGTEFESFWNDLVEIYIRNKNGPEAWSKFKKITMNSCHVFGIGINQLETGREHPKPIVKAIICYLMYYHSGSIISTNELSEMMGYKNHSSVISHLQSFKNQYQTNKAFRDNIEKIVNETFAEEAEQIIHKININQKIIA